VPEVPEVPKVGKSCQSSQSSQKLPEGTKLKMGAERSLN